MGSEFEGETKMWNGWDKRWSTDENRFGQGGNFYECHFKSVDADRLVKASAITNNDICLQGEANRETYHEENVLVHDHYQHERKQNDMKMTQEEYFEYYTQWGANTEKLSLKRATRDEGLG